MEHERPEEVDRQRRERFGTLPPRVRPDELVESVDTRFGEAGRPGGPLTLDQVMINTAAG